MKKAVDDSFKAIPKDDYKEEDGGNDEEQQQQLDDTNEGGSDCMNRGRDIHDSLAQKVNNYGDTRYGGKYGKLIQAIENRLECRFVRAEVSVYGFSLIDNKSEAKRTEQLFWRGAIDAVGVTKEGKLFLVEWKTLSRTEKLNDFWRQGSDRGYVPALHQSLLYRKLLNIHLATHRDLSKIFKRVLGVMIVPIRQDFQDVNDTDPRICWSFAQMQQTQILNGINNLVWEISPFKLIQRVDFKAKLFCSKKDSSKTRHWYTENVKLVKGNRSLKDTALLKNIFKQSAKVKDLREALKLPPLVDVESEEESD